MRLILTNQSINNALLDRCDNLAVFHSFEEFSVGPLNDWTCPQAFTDARKEFWSKVPNYHTLAHLEWQYVEWIQQRAQIRSSELAQLSVTSWPPVHSLAELLPKADIIELWVSPNTNCQIFQMYVLAALDRDGIDPAKIKRCWMPDKVREHWPDTFWKKNLMNALDREARPEDIPLTERADLIEFWAAISQGTTINLAAIKDPIVKRSLSVMQGRVPCPMTGFSNIQSYLLKAGSSQLQPMSATIHKAMVYARRVGDHISDQMLQHTLREMTQRYEPLFEIHGQGHMNKCVARITNAGVLAQSRLMGIPYANTNAEFQNRVSYGING